MQRFIAVLLSLVMTSALAEVFTWTDDNGIKHYSDKPHKNATKIKLKHSQTYSSQPTNDESGTYSYDESPLGQEETGLAGDGEYQQVSLIQPSDESTFRSNEGEVPVTIALKPMLLKGHRIVMVLDGKPHPEAQTTTSFALYGIVTGAHTIAAKIIDDNNRLVAETKSVRFYMKHHRINQFDQNDVPLPSPVTPDQNRPTVGAKPVVPNNPLKPPAFPKAP